MNINNIYRDKTIDCITEEDVGKSCKVAGWVENIRDHGGVSFVDLRDMYGVLQVVREIQVFSMVCLRRTA